MTHTGVLKVHGCVNLKRTTQISWKEQIFKVRLRFMFHYCTFRRKTAAFRSLPLWVCDPESAAFGCNKSTNKDEQGRLSPTDAPHIRGSALFVVVRPLSWLFAFTLTESFLVRLQSCLQVWHSASAMCISHHERPPELVALVEALMLRKSVFQLKARLLKAVRSELQVAKDSGLTWRVIWETLRDEGYPGGYQQFCKAANRVIEGVRLPTASNGENLPPPAVEREVRQQTGRASGLSSENTAKKEKPAWEVRREEEMARLDREAELNHQRESRLQPTKVFRPSVFVGRSED